MSEYHSLHQYLDKQLPGSFVIALRNFFSFLPFVSPVDKRITELRKLVKQAKKTPDSFNYCLNFQENEQYFRELFPQSSFNYSPPESNFLRVRESGAYVLQQLQPSIKVSASLAIEKLEPQPEPEPDFLAQVKNIAEDKDWQEPLEQLLGSLDSTQIVKLAKKLIQRCGNSEQENLKRCAIAVVDWFKLDTQNLKKELFDDLQTDEGLRDYDDFLNIKGALYRSQLLLDFSLLGNREDCVKKSVYRVQRDFLQLNHSLRGLRQGGLIQEQEDTINTIASEFNNWQSAHSTNDKEIKSLIETISSCLTQLKELILEFKDPRLKEKSYKDRIAENEARNRIDKAQEFTQKMMSGEITTTSIQRIAELFPDENDFKKKIEQCRLLGVQVFDASNPEIVNSVINEHHNAIQARMGNL